MRFQVGIVGWVWGDSAAVGAARQNWKRLGIGMDVTYNFWLLGMFKVLWLALRSKGV